MPSQWFICLAFCFFVYHIIIKYDSFGCHPMILKKINKWKLCCCVFLYIPLQVYIWIKVQFQALFKVVFGGKMSSKYCCLCYWKTQLLYSIYRQNFNIPK